MKKVLLAAIVIAMLSACNPRDDRPPIVSTIEGLVVEVSGVQHSLIGCVFFGCQIGSTKNSDLGGSLTSEKE